MRRVERTGGWKAGLMRLPDIEHCIAALREHAGAAGRRGQRAGRARTAVADFPIAKNPGKFRCGVVIARQRAAYRTDPKGVMKGKSGSVRVEHGGRHLIQKNKIK